MRVLWGNDLSMRRRSEAGRSSKQNCLRDLARLLEYLQRDSAPLAWNAQWAGDAHEAVEQEADKRIAVVAQQSSRAKS
jgi:hypothetical protein